jgi:hypothetical protein
VCTSIDCLPLTSVNCRRLATGEELLLFALKKVYLLYLYKTSIDLYLEVKQPSGSYFHSIPDISLV